MTEPSKKLTGALGGMAVVAALGLGGGGGDQPAWAATARDYITVVGSSSVFPFSTSAAEQFGRSRPDFRTPKVESTGTGGGIKLFCSGVGVQHPDIANASRRIKQTEIDSCRANGVVDIVEVRIGYDGIVMAHGKASAPMRLTLRDVWLALADKVPDPKDERKLIDNPHQTWRDVNPALPDSRIEVLGPPPTSGTRDAFAELALEGGCSTFSWIEALKARDERQYREICHTIREDNLYVEAGENDNLIVQKLVANPRALGIFGYSFLDQNLDKLRAATIGGVAPEYEAIADGKYPVARTLYVYVKKAHVGVIPGIPEFLAELSSDRAMGPEGYLADKGLIALPTAERRKVQADIRSMRSLPARL